MIATPHILISDAIASKIPNSCVTYCFFEPFSSRHHSPLRIDNFWQKMWHSVTVIDGILGILSLAFITTFLDLKALIIVFFGVLPDILSFSTHLFFKKAGNKYLEFNNFLHFKIIDTLKYSIRFKILVQIVVSLFGILIIMV